MTIQRKFVLFFSGSVLLVAIAISAVAVGFLKNAYDRMVHAANASYLPVMASHMFFSAAITFVVIGALVLALSIPLGILLSRRLSEPYLRIFRNLSDIAQKRLDIGTKTGIGGGERAILEKYIALLVGDLNNLKEYEKVKSWKDGARLLMHELKNPLTPLKLSAQKLSLAGSPQNGPGDDVKRILVSLTDIERILSMFRDLVNIEFGQRIDVDFGEFMQTLKLQLAQSNLACPVHTTLTASPIVVFTEPTLLRMAAINLIRNGMEENAPAFHVCVKDQSDRILMEFCTPGAHIRDAGRLFRPGYSSKAGGRGFGLFLCKMISDYLDLNLTYQDAEKGVTFSISIEKSHSIQAGGAKSA
jgi:nitrogen fixation/metabolism regulation signal transduction histidine kinase